MAIHLTSYVTVWLASIHAGLAGTDTTNVAYRAVAVALTILAAAATLTRVRAGRRGRRPASPAHDPALRHPRPLRARHPAQARTSLPSPHDR